MRSIITRAQQSEPRKMTGGSRRASGGSFGIAKKRDSEDHMSSIRIVEDFIYSVNPCVDKVIARGAIGKLSSNKSYAMAP